MSCCRSPSGFRIKQGVSACERFSLLQAPLLTVNLPQAKKHEQYQDAKTGEGATSALRWGLAVVDIVGLSGADKYRGGTCRHMEAGVKVRIVEYGGGGGGLKRVQLKSVGAGGPLKALGFSVGIKDHNDLIVVGVQIALVVGQAHYNQAWHLVRASVVEVDHVHNLLGAFQAEQR